MNWGNSFHINIIAIFQWPSWWYHDFWTSEWHYTFISFKIVNRFYDPSNKPWLLGNKIITGFYAISELYGNIKLMRFCTHLSHFYKNAISVILTNSVNKICMTAGNQLFVGPIILGFILIDYCRAICKIANEFTRLIW